MAYYQAAEYLLQRTGCHPEVGIICGSGLSGLSDTLSNRQSIPYTDIPGFPQTSVQGHVGEMVFGQLGGISSVCLRGRFHFYEGHGMDSVTLPVRVMRLLGVKLLIVTNAAGGLNPMYKVGDIAIIRDHLGLPIMAGQSPLRGPNDDLLGPRFPAMSDAYSPEVTDIIFSCAKELGLESVVRNNATYCFVSGPAYESIAEAKWLRSMGGDAVGMSTVPEVVAAKHCGMTVVGMSLITNNVVIDYNDTNHASHEEVLAAVNTSGRNVQAIVTALVSKERIGKLLSNIPSSNALALKKKAESTSTKSKSKGNYHNPYAAMANGAVILFVLGMIFLKHKA